MRTLALGATATVLLGLVVAVLVYLPRYQVRGVTLEPPDTSAKIAGLINEYRRTLIQAVAGLFVAIGAVSGAFFAWQQITAVREGQVTDRFTKAVAQLGDQNLPVRIGGIYALERIAKDSPLDHAATLETLVGFIHEHTPTAAATQEAQPSVAWPKFPRPRIRGDLQAALTVLGRRAPIQRTPFEGDTPMREKSPALKEKGVIDLDGLNLAGANLGGAYLETAHLSGTNFRGASFVGANLRKSMLLQSKFDHAIMSFANMEDAMGVGASFSNANIDNAHLERAALTGANFDNASFRNAHLDGALLLRATFTGADLSGVDLSNVKELTREQVAGAKTDAHTKFPWSA